MKYTIVISSQLSDLQSAKLVEQIRKLDFRAEISAVGAVCLEAEGVELIANHGSFPENRTWPVALFDNISLVTSVKKLLRKAKPDVLIVVGLSTKSLRIASLARKRGIKACLIINSDMELKKSSVRNKVSRYFDRVFTATPPSKNYLEIPNILTKYVGNPVVESIKDYQFDSQFTLNQQEVNIAVLTPMNKKELKRSAPLIEQLIAEKPEYIYHIALSNHANGLFDRFDSFKNVRLSKSHRYEFLKHCNAAICLSSAGTFEAGIMNCPSVLVSKGRLVSLGRWRSLINSIGGKEIVQELVGSRYNLETVLTELHLILSDQHYCATILDEFQRVKGLLGHEKFSKKTARIIVEWLEESGSS